MLTNILSASSSQNHSGAAQAGQNSAACSGPSFASMLNTEMTTAAPATATPPAPAPVAAAPAVPAPTASAPATPTPTPAPAAVPQSDSNTTTAKATEPKGQDSNGAAGSTETEPKKSGKTTKISDTVQADSAAQAAAATAATLAAVAAGVNVTNAAAKKSNTSAASVSNAAQLNMLAGTTGSTGLQTNALTGDSGKIGSKTGMLTDQPQPAAGIAPLTLSAVGAKPDTSNGNSGKNNNPEQYTAAFNKALDASGASAAKTGATPALVVPAVTNGSAAASLSAQISPIPVDMLAQNIKTANQDLSSAQMSAMAPILAAPNANLQNIAASDAITPQVGSPAWDQAIGQKINWMVAGGQQNATLTLNPPNLGPMQIVLSVNNQHASATFIAQQPEVRAALEHAIPKLREMMEQSGIQLGQCNVNSQAQQQQQQQQASTSRNSSRDITGAGTVSNMSDVASSQSGQMAASRSGNGLVDTFV